MEYASLSQLRRRLPNAKTDAQTDTDLTEILGAASRMIDRYCRVADNYFAPPVPAESSKVVYGNGRSFLDLPATVYGSVTITAPAGFTVPNFTIIEDRAITLTEENTRSPYIVWQAGIPYTITGTWGMGEIPEDIREATLQTAVRWYRGKDEAFSGVIGGINKDNSIIERALPAPVRLILDNWTRRTRKVIFA